MSSMQTPTSQRVARGVAYLDKRDPDWVDKITRPVNLTSDFDCMLGQVFGSFFGELRKAFHLPHEFFVYALTPFLMVWTTRRGFFDWSEEKQRALEEEWNSVIFERRFESRLRAMNTQFQWFDERRCQQAAARIREFEASHEGRLSNEKDQVSA